MRKLLKTMLCKPSHQRNKYLGSLHCKIFGTILKMDWRKTQIKGPEGKEVDYNGHSFTSERRCRQIMCIKKEEGKELAIPKDCVHSLIRGVEDYIQKRKERLSTATSKSSDKIRTTTFRKHK